MEARLRYQRELQSNGVSKQLGDHKKNPPKKKSEVSTATSNQRVPKTSSHNNESQPPQHVEKKTTKEAPAHHEPRIDFIQKNIEQASSQKSRAKVPQKEPKHFENQHAPGEIPHFVEERKTQLTERKDPTPKYQIPPGMRLMTQGEKEEAISSLLIEKKEIESELAHAPLKIESETAKREIRIREDKLKEIDKSIEQLRAKFVLIPDDETL